MSIRLPIRIGSPIGEPLFGSDGQPRSEAWPNTPVKDREKRGSVRIGFRTEPNSLAQQQTELKFEEKDKNARKIKREITSKSAMHRWSKHAPSPTEASFEGAKC